MSAVDDVYAYIESQGLANGATGWLLVRRRLVDQPNAPAQTVVVAEDGGNEPEMGAPLGIGDAATSDVGVLVTVRAGAWDGDSGAAKASAILAALHGLRNVVLGGEGSTTYFRVKALMPEPVFAGFDAQGRPMHTVALRLLRLV